mmetsp:Transcript_60921/g.143695  ORF Transcript_60921/g.143695 Transcript_60921/m.143695 type:complete len:312 (+) Transcript_60921:908-1843(+)
MLVLPEFQGLSISSQISGHIGRMLQDKCCQLQSSHKNIKVHWHRERSRGVWLETAKVKDRGPLFPGQTKQDRVEKDPEQHYSGRFVGSTDDQASFLDRWQQKKPGVVAERNRLVEKRQREKDKEKDKSSQEVRRGVNARRRKRRKTQHLKRGGAESELANTQSQHSQPVLAAHVVGADENGKAAAGLAARVVRAQQRIAALERSAEAERQGRHAEKEAAEERERALRERAEAEERKVEGLRQDAQERGEQEERLQKKAGQLFTEKRRLEERVRELEREQGESKAAAEAEQRAAEERKQQRVRRESEQEREK